MERAQRMEETGDQGEKEREAMANNTEDFYQQHGDRREQQELKETTRGCTQRPGRQLSPS
jgi:hypothetical protein